MRIISKLLLFRKQILPRVLHYRMERLTLHHLELSALLFRDLNARIHHIPRQADWNIVPERELLVVLVTKEVLGHVR